MQGLGIDMGGGGQALGWTGLSVGVCVHGFVGGGGQELALTDFGGQERDSEACYEEHGVALGGALLQDAFVQCGVVDGTWALKDALGQSGGVDGNTEVSDALVRSGGKDGSTDSQGFGIDMGGDGQGLVTKACYEERGVAMGDALRAANEEVERVPRFSGEFWVFYIGRPHASSEPGWFDEQMASIRGSLRQTREIPARASARAYVFLDSGRRCVRFFVATGWATVVRHGTMPPPGI